MPRTKKMPRMGEGKRALQVQTRAEVHTEQEPPVLVDPPVPEVETALMQSELERKVEEAEVARVVADLTVGPDGCRGWAIYVRWAGTGQEEALTYHGRQRPLRRNSSRLEK